MNQSMQLQVEPQTEDKPIEASPSQLKAAGSRTRVVFPKRKRKIDWVPASFIVAVHLMALAFCIPTFSWKALAVCLVLHWITGGLGITLGYHRLLTHRSFKTPKAVEYLLTMLACLACQAGPITWVAAHRAHHANSDNIGDPHSPQESFLWAHMVWCLCQNPEIDTPAAQERWAPDLYHDRGHMFLERAHILWTVLLALGLYAAGGWSFVVWGIFVRLVFVYHSTWLVNSAAHVWGYRTYEANDQSTNLWWVALLTYGEGWHNNHHAFQQSARHGLRWWEIDTTYWMIKTLQVFGLASAVKIPSAHQLSLKTAAAR